MERRYYHDMLGYNFRLSDLHAAIGLAQMGRLDDFTASRRANAAYLNENIKSVITPCVRRGHGHVYRSIHGACKQRSVTRCGCQAD